MSRPAATGERWVAIFLLALLLFSPPLLSIFSEHHLLAVPFIYVYLFFSWGLVIALAALAVEGGPPPAERGPLPPEDEEDAAAGGEG